MGVITEEQYLVVDGIALEAGKDSEKQQSKNAPSPSCSHVVTVHVQIQRQPRKVRFDLNTDAREIPLLRSTRDVLDRWYSKQEYKSFRSQCHKSLKRANWNAALQRQQRLQQIVMPNTRGLEYYGAENARLRKRRRRQHVRGVLREQQRQIDAHQGLLLFTKVGSILKDDLMRKASRRYTAGPVGEARRFGLQDSDEAVKVYLETLRENEKDDGSNDYGDDAASNSDESIESGSSESDTLYTDEGPTVVEEVEGVIEVTWGADP